MYCRWMDIELTSPFMMASLTLFSNVNVDKLVDFYRKARQLGTGAIIIPSINPANLGADDKNNVMIDTKVIKTGIKRNNAEMGFTLLGPAYPNLISLHFGIRLLKNLKDTNIGIPLIASVANYCTEEKLLEAVDSLNCIGVDGIELNFSCPNIVLQSENMVNLDLKILRKIREITKVPLSLKLVPNIDYSELLANLNNEINSITISNATIGLLPPSIKRPFTSDFNKIKFWAPSGIYGPSDRLTTYYNIYRYQKVLKGKNIDIACVGGIINGEQAIQALLLGADAVQFSSAIAWEGLQVLEQSKHKLIEFMNQNGFSNVDEFKGYSSRNYLKDNASEIEWGISKKATVNRTKCNKCNNCICCDRLCIAIWQDTDKSVNIDKELCSGCGWCAQTCIASAIVLNP